MDGILGALRERRDDLDGVFYEVFSRTPRQPEGEQTAGPVDHAPASLIRFQRSNREAVWSAGAES